MQRLTLSRVLGVLFILFALPKLLSVPMAADNFVKWGLGDGGRYAVGALELALGFALLIERLRIWATLGLLSVMAGAVLVHLVAREYVMVPMPIVFGLLLVRVLARDGRLRFTPTTT
jgi:hypothetical protein